jgi:hypothetical protein
VHSIYVVNLCSIFCQRFAGLHYCDRGQAACGLEHGPGGVRAGVDLINSPIWPQIFQKKITLLKMNKFSSKSS